MVFGCGGDRDRGKRPVMGKYAAEYADQVIVTDDNPRTENAAAIRAEVMQGCPDATEIGDRAVAIAQAVSGLTGDDILLIAGKVHETGQKIGTTIHPFDDVVQAKTAIALSDGTAAGGGV